MKQVLFIHIPRTAGSSMVRRIEANVPDYQNIYTACRCVSNSNLSGPFISAGHARVGLLLGRRIISREWYGRCYRFAFVRNTWDRLASIYKFYHRYRYLQRHRRYAHRKYEITNDYLADFSKFVQAVVSDNWLGGQYKVPVSTSPMFGFAYSQLEWLRWGADFIGSYENLDADWKRLCGIIGMRHQPLEKRRSVEGKPWRKWYNKRLRNSVADHYAEEIERFGFRFNE